MKDRRLIPLKPGHQLRLLTGGRALFPELVRAVDRSVHEIRLETYIFQFDVSGEQVAQALMRAARRGVAVYLVMDGVGTPTLPTSWAAQFDQAGVQWRIFRPLGWIGLLIPSRWRRLHRKLCVIDGRVAFCGGINVLDDWQDPNHGELQFPRLDFAVRVTGPLVREVHDATMQFWWRLEAAREARKVDLSASWHDLEQVVRLAMQGEEPDVTETEPGHAIHGHARAALLLRDNLSHRSRIERAYRKAIAEAREEIIIANAYFVPGRKLRQALIHAAQRGVTVKLLLQGRYEYFMQYHSVRLVYGVLLEAGIQIYEYEPSFLHAKVAVIDRQWATVGSSNLDPLSLLLAREANVVVVESGFAKELHGRLEHAISKDGRRVDPARFASRPWQQRLLDGLAFALMRTAIFLSGNRY